LKVLLVEDNPGDARLLREMFNNSTSRATELTHVATMSEAEKYVAENPVDVIVLDLGLPDAEGLGAVRRAVAAAHDIPLVVLTGSDEALALRALQEGAQDYLIKGQIETRGLLRALQHAIERKMMEVKITNDIVRLKRTELQRDAYEEKLEKSNADLAILTTDLGQARDMAERATRAKSRFLTGMSHELRTPLNGILGYAHLLRMEGELTAAQVARIDAMLGAGKHLLEMITCVLDLSEIEADHLVLRPVRFDVQAIAAACLDLVRPMTDAKGLSLRIVVGPGTRRELVADPTRLRQILLNVLGNAAKFTSLGGVELRMRTLADNSALRIEVSDTGPGISAAQRQRLFQDFERVDTDSKVEGAGLGLALSTRLATLMGGRLGHDGNPGGGSVFWLELPLDTVPLSLPTMAANLNSADAGKMPAPARVLRVLVVDDVLMNRDIAGAFLRGSGHEVVCLEGGAEAVAAAAITDFDVILMDVRMPEMDGLEATRRIRALDGPRGGVPIVALTAQAFLDQISECREAGMDSHLAKPFDPESLLAIVMRAVGAEMPAIAAAKSPVIEPRSPLRMERVILDETLEYLTADEISGHLQSLGGRMGQLSRLLDQMDAPALLEELAHTLVANAGMFGFEALSVTSREFERALTFGAPVPERLVEKLRTEINAALLILGGLVRETRMQTA
jgi:signal transduction histidine kinase